MAKKFAMPAEDREISQMPGHWVLAQLGKKVLRPGGRELTQKMLGALDIGPEDRVVEFAPGMGFTARLCLEKGPASYTAIEQDEQAAQIVRSFLQGPAQNCKVGNAQETGLDEGIFTVVYVEAMLSIQSDEQKRAIIAEAARILEAGGRFGIHELCLIPDDIAPEQRRNIEEELTDVIRFPTLPITPSEWEGILNDCGFTLVYKATAPMLLLEPWRVIRDEGLGGFLKLAGNILCKPKARQSVFTMRRVFKKHQRHLSAITLVARKKDIGHAEVI